MICKCKSLFLPISAKKWAISAICIVFLIKVAILSLIGGAVMVEKLATDLMLMIFIL